MCAGGTGGLEADAAGWMPPEALAASAAVADSAHGSWRCETCGMLNAANATKCENCDTHKMVSDMQRAERAKEESRAATAAANVRSGKKKKGKGSKVSLQDLHVQTAVNQWQRGV